MTTRIKPSKRSAPKPKSPVGVTVCAVLAALAVILTLLVPETAAAQVTETVERASRSGPTEIAKVQPALTFTAGTTNETDDGHTVIFEAPATADQPGLAAGPPSCAFDCIEHAWLSSNLSSTALTLTVETNLAAAIRYEVGAHTPFLGLDGVPYFPAPVSVGHSPGDTDLWTTTVGGLAGNTDYYVIVEATSGGGTHVVTGMVRTVTPAHKSLDTFENHVDGGCSLSCITAANLVTYPDEGDRVGWVVETLVPTAMLALFSDQPVAWIDGTPTFTDIGPSAAQFSFTTEFIGSVDGLDTATLYNVIISATDIDGNTDYFVDQIQTPPLVFDLVYAPLRTIVHENGDAVGRGEVSFNWHIGDAATPLHSGTRGQQKIADGESFYFAEHLQYLVPHVAETQELPNFTVFGYDHDPFSFATLGIPGELHNWIWNGFFSAQTVADLDHFPTCASFDEIASDHPFASSPCIKLQNHPGGTPGNNGDAPHFTTILAIHKSPAIDNALPG